MEAANGAEGTPTATLAARYRGTGTLLRREYQIPVGAFRLEWTPYDCRSGPLLVAFVEEQAQRPEGWQAGDLLKFVLLGNWHGEPLVFEGKTSEGQLIRIPDVQPRNLAGREFTGTAPQFDVGAESIDYEADSQTVTVLLTDALPADSADQERPGSWAGLPGYSFQRPSRRIQLATAAFELIALASNERVRVGMSDVRVAVPRCALVSSRAVGEGQADVVALMEFTATEVANLLTLMSLFARNRVDWYEMRVRSEGRDNQGRLLMREAVRRRMAREPASSEPLSGLVSPAAISDGALSAAVSELSGLSFLDSVRLSIGLLVEASHTRDLSYFVLNAFTALEALMDGLGSRDGSGFTLPEATFDALRERLKAEIREFSKEHRIDARARSAMYGKIGELARAPLIPRIVAAIQAYQVQSDDLWQRDWKAREQSLERRLSSAYARRSALVHTGRLPDPEASWLDALRIHAITERLIVAVVGGNGRWFASSAYRAVDRAMRVARGYY